jgi:hypothetical protein
VPIRAEEAAVLSAARSLAVGASRAARIATTALFSQAEMDEAATLAVPYRAPGD